MPYHVTVYKLNIFAARPYDDFTMRGQAAPPWVVTQHSLVIIACICGMRLDECAECSAGYIMRIWVDPVL